jgi:glycine/D-amino acid oxidase-like deaminating enzyme
MFEAVVIGARCAGASTALLPARRGLDVRGDAERTRAFYLASEGLAAVA